MTATRILQTEYTFSLPCGYADEMGTLHRDGVMRLATTRDEVEPLGDPRVQRNQAYLSVLLLSRVVSQLGEVTNVTPEVIEGLYSADFIYLQDLYVRINDRDDHLIDTQCPDCGCRFTLDLQGQSSDG
jgi:hypothetical protein